MSAALHAPLRVYMERPLRTVILWDVLGEGSPGDDDLSLFGPELFSVLFCISYQTYITPMYALNTSRWLRSAFSRLAICTGHLLWFVLGRIS